MSQPPSLKTTPFATFGNNSFGTVFTSDYVHKKLGNFNLKAPTLKNGNFGLKLGVSLNDRPGVTPLLSLSDEVKIGFPFVAKENKFYLETRLRRNGEVKFHLDEGNWNLANKKFNFFSNVKTNMSLDSCTYRFGANYFGEQCESGTRLEGSKDKNFNLTQRNIIREGSFLFASALTVGLSDFKLTKYDALFKYNHNKFDIYLQHFTPKIDKTAGLTPGKFAFNVIYNYNPNETFGFHYKYNVANKKSRVVVGVVHKVNDDWTVKAKVDQKLKLTASTKNKLNDKLTLTTGLQLNLQNGANALDFSKKIPLPIGFNLDINA